MSFHPRSLLRYNIGSEGDLIDAARRLDEAREKRAGTTTGTNASKSAQGGAVS